MYNIDWFDNEITRLGLEEKIIAWVKISMVLYVTEATDVMSYDSAK